jgi:hypothetical protein
VATDVVPESEVEFARAALLSEVIVDHVGDFLVASADDDQVTTYFFESRSPGYLGWRWAVSAVRISSDARPTVDEVVLLPGPDSLLAPAWVPWGERIRPGDLGTGDVLPTIPEDPRLVPGYSGADDLAGEAADEPLSPRGWQLGLGRERVLSEHGRSAAADRWRAGDFGPDGASVRVSPSPCSTCGFLLPIGGPLGTAFGICANAFATSDGRAVTLDHGCGGHSEVLADPVLVPMSEPLIDEFGYDEIS